MNYEIVYSLDGESYSCIARHNPDGSVSFIPIDESNQDYLDYLNFTEMSS